jgi:hypothetical protein
MDYSGTLNKNKEILPVFHLYDFNQKEAKWSYI